MEEITQKVSEFITQYKLPLALSVAGLICLVYGLISLSEQNQQNDIIFENSNQQSSEESATRSKIEQTLVIDIAGAVKNPGVYPLPEESRVKDAIAAAGGLSEDADTAVIARQFNFAMKVSDGMKLYLPKTGEEQSNTQDVSNVSDLRSTKININTSSESELDTLPGIGKVTAGKVISSRPYTTIDELLTRKIVSQKVFEQIKDSISTY